MTPMMPPADPVAAMLAAPEPAPTIRRDEPEPEASRAALVSDWCKRVAAAREFWDKRHFRQMVRDMKFAAGEQWSGEQAPVALADGTLLDDPKTRYVANITLRHINTRTARIYGKNPKIVARRKPRLNSLLWDGSQRSLQTAMMALQSGMDMTGQAQIIVQDAMAAMAQDQQQNKLARTLELLFEHELDEQPVPFKVSMKGVVRRGLTTGVAWTKLGYQRVMQLKPEVGAQVESLTQQLATLERLGLDRTAGDFTDDDPRMEQIKLLIQTLAQNGDNYTTVREGLLFTFPDSTAIIPDTNCKSLRGFLGAGWVAEEYFLTADQIKDTYRVEIKAAEGGDPGARCYDRSLTNEFRARDRQGSDGKPVEDAFFCVWEIYNRADGLVYVVCEGHPDFLQPPAKPDITLERFFPWFPFLVNEVEAPNAVFPPSDVTLIRDMQMELNRARQGLREHRRAARPRTYGRRGVLSDDDKAKLEAAEAHTHVELDGIQPNEKIQDVLQDYSGPKIDPSLYDPSPVWEDYLRTLGQTEAQLGGTSGGTATEASFAEAARGSDASSVVDDLDEFLSELSRASGQVLLMECSADKVRTIVGQGAVWPELSREEVAREIYLDVEAASTGRPNKAAEVQNAQIVFPLLMQIPNLDPEWLARELLRRMDDKVDITDAFASGMPSIQQLNGMKQIAAPEAQAQGRDPGAQGGQGGNNVPSTQPAQTATGPRPVEPGVQPQVNQAPVV